MVLGYVWVFWVGWTEDLGRNFDKFKEFVWVNKCKRRFIEVIDIFNPVARFFKFTLYTLLFDLKVLIYFPTRRLMDQTVLPILPFIQAPIFNTQYYVVG